MSNKFEKDSLEELKKSAKLSWSGNIYKELTELHIQQIDRLFCLTSPLEGATDDNHRFKFTEK